MDKKNRYISSTILDDGTIVELIFNKETNITRLATYLNGNYAFHDYLTLKDEILLPYKPDNAYLKHNLVLFPSDVVEYKDPVDLIEEITLFIHRYLDISEYYEKIAIYYILFTWLYDNFEELPYLRALGDYGSGKTRFLKVVGSLCYKPTFTMGATSISPIFRIIDKFRGTLVVDEADLKFSDTSTEMVKILNCGHTKGIPILRSADKKKGFEPETFDVFCPKILASREKFQDDALESRFLTEEMERTERELPINLTNEFYSESLEIRNKLLFWRFQNYGKNSLRKDLEKLPIEPRLKQILIPLASIIKDEQMVNELKDYFISFNRKILLDRGMGFEASIVEVILKMMDNNEVLYIKNIANKYNEIEKPKRDFSAKRMGYILRDKLKLFPERTGDGYIIPERMHEKINKLKVKFGINEQMNNMNVVEPNKEEDRPVDSFDIPF